MRPLPAIIHLWIALAFSSMVSITSEKCLATSPIPLQIATFDLDVTPPVGFMMAYDRVRRVDELGLRCRGVVLIGREQPIVLCAVDWIGIANESNQIFRERIAKAAGTTALRVAVHTLHQHDAPRSDFGAERILHQIGATELGAHDGSFAREVLDRIETAVRDSMNNPQKVTHVSFGTANVQRIASNRRIQDSNGKVIATRYTATRDPAIRDLPEGTIDPQLTAITFWQVDQPLAVMTYYACHPQSYYRTGVPSPDFPGIARFMRGQDLPQTLHIHFAGAGGNVGAGKYNDGSPENRLILANRLAQGMKSAFDQSEKVRISDDDVKWTAVKAHLPPAAHLDKKKLTQDLNAWDGKTYWGSADKLAWLQQCESQAGLDIGCLQLGKIRILHMPGELFVEYQLAAKAMRPDLQIAMAAYGDYGPGYIGTAIAYQQGGYETSELASNVAPTVEEVLTGAMKSLLDVHE